MSVVLDKGSDSPADSEAPRPSPKGVPLPLVPNLGRTVHVVGPVVNVDTNQLPHPKNQRGELGKALFNWYHNTVSKDPLTRVSAPNHNADRRNFLTTVVNRAPKGDVNPRTVPVDDPAAGQPGEGQPTPPDEARRRPGLSLSPLGAAK